MPLSLIYTNINNKISVCFDAAIRKICMLCSRICIFETSYFKCLMLEFEMSELSKVVL